MNCVTPCLLLLAAGSQAATAANARILDLEQPGWAGSSVNVVAGIRHSLVTDRDRQFTAFYDPEGTVVLAARALGADDWRAQRTPYRADVVDAHNHVALAVDGAGRLHLAWGHHDSPLNYARSTGVRALFPERAPMLGDREAGVTYPQFHRLPDGGLLFLYRNGESGRGDLVVNRYDVAEARWQRLHDTLIDGEGERSAYWDAAVDADGRVHLAWNWRETPDVASNHDIHYARSDDGGRSWRSAEGAALSVPFTQASVKPAVRVPQNHNLMNPPAVTTDGQGRPVIADYWSDDPDSPPRFRVVFHDGSGWQVRPGPEIGIPFSLAGGGTRRPPVSRAAVLAATGQATTSVYVVYRDDGRGGSVIGASAADIRNPEWRIQRLAPGPYGGWEPNVDPSMWRRFRQVHVLLQAVQQVDGRDDISAGQKSSPVSVLAWTPNAGRVGGEMAPARLNGGH